MISTEQVFLQVQYFTKFEPELKKSVRSKQAAGAGYDHGMAKNQPDTNTSSRNVAIRYLLTVISFLFRNIRMSLQWIFQAHVLRGPRTIDGDVLRFFEVSG